MEVLSEPLEATRKHHAILRVAKNIHASII